ncbi:MAG TPA: valine--tRNA ligase [Candidatus Eisenbacteria bacterium]|nr:valine--tRNA ligase [Candidatus Eisenbacteria bacterium]
MSESAASERTSALDHPYDPAEVESHWYRHWVEKGYFTPQLPSALDDATAAELRKKAFTIFIPPPNVTGSLTMGHVLVQSLQDVVIRWRRKEGDLALWLPGTDHAGIATQNVVERMLAERGRTRHELGRDGFLKEVWQWKEKYGGLITEQEKRLGCSLDWTRERFTMDEGLSRAVNEVFVRLYRKGLVYRGHYIVNWCPRCLTALSDEEVNHEEREGQLWHIKYPIKGTEKFLTVATTRPETMLGDVAVAVAPKDRRYSKLVGKTLVLPLMRREIPVIADEYVDPKFGTGAVKVTPAHDPNDFAIGQRHGLEPIVVMNPDGTMSDKAGDFAGLDRFAARKRVLERLSDLGLLARTETHKLSIGTCDRCDTIVEPYLSLQWFVRMKPLAEPAIEAAKRKRVKFFPPRWTKVYMHWMTHIRDWCISRQLWWGHRIPVWYCEAPGCNEIIVDTTPPTECTKCHGGKLRQDEDVLDTWFSSWLWPFSTLGWPERTNDLRVFYPGSLLVTGPDIIFFWVARMIMAGDEFMGEEPFPHVYLNSIVRDAQGRKMSKSLGNSPDPIEIMNRYGADALRFTTIFLTPTGQDLIFDEKRCETGKFFANKIWNAAKLVSMRLGDLDPTTVRDSQLTLTLTDRWIVSRYARCVRDTTRYLKTYRFNDAANAVYRFAWHEYCDWYLELVKPRWSDEGAVGDPAGARTARVIAHRVLEGILHLLHPFMPFLTEEVWQAIPHQGESITVAPWPKAKKAWFDADAEADMALLRDLVVAVRNLRAEMNLPPAKMVPVVVRGDEKQSEKIRANRDLLAPLARVDQWTISPQATRPGVAASAVVRGMEVWLPLAGLVDLDAERMRLAREADRVLGDLEGTRRKLMNQDFLTKAKKEVVERERAKLAQLEETVAKLKRAEEALRA